MKQRKIAGYGYKPDLPDHRDYSFYSIMKTIALPALVDLRSKCPPVYDQGELGSCTANAIAAAFQFELDKQSLKDFTPSRLFIYYNERVIEGSVKEDSGAQIRDGIKSVASQGVCDENKWPYIIKKFKTKPSNRLYVQALKDLAVTYYRIDNTNLNALKTCLAQGSPFVFGISVYESFESDHVASSGMVPIPKKTERMLGGHAILCVGYDDSKKCFIFRNSWSSNWALDGYAYIPYGYLTNTNLADDFWAITTVCEN